MPDYTEINLIEKALLIVQELELLKEKEKYVSSNEKSFYSRARAALLKELSGINDKIAEEAKRIEIDKNSQNIKNKVSISRYSEDFEQEIEILKKAARGIKKKLKKEIIDAKRANSSINSNIVIKKPSSYESLSNRVFGNYSFKLVKSGKFSGLRDQIKKADIQMLTHSYVSIIFLTTLLTFLLGALVATFLTFFSIVANFGFPPLVLEAKEFTITTLIRNILLFIIIFPSFIFLVAYNYPKLESYGRKRVIDDEMPFMITHMAAVAGSGVEPTQVFKIIAESRDYKYVNKEISRVVNKINIYGYDLLTAINESAKTSSDKVRELLNGMASIITSGGDIKKYLEDKAEDSLNEYRLSRQRYSSVASTYADIYTALLLIAPLIFGIILYIMPIIGDGKIFGFVPSTFSIIGLSAIIAVNIIFLIILNLVQP